MAPHQEWVGAEGGLVAQSEWEGHSVGRWEGQRSEEAEQQG